MTTRVRRLKILVALVVILSLTIVLLVPSYSAVGVILRVGTEGSPLPSFDFSAVPQSVVDDANILATEVCTNAEEEYDDFVDQLLATYLEAKGKDFVMIFNPGGWGWNLLEASPQWNSIFTGIQSELNNLGYTSLLLDYRRTINTLAGRFDELISMVNLYPSKAKDLDGRVEFLTRNIPNLKVIIAGESSGAVIADTVMSILRNNAQVYSIQTGPPFWYKNNMLDRTLVLKSGGIIPDAFSQGDFLTILRANLEDLFGFSRLEDTSGKILIYIGSPGHDYWWQYPEVCSQVTNFLEQNFGV